MALAVALGCAALAAGGCGNDDDDAPYERVGGGDVPAEAPLERELPSSSR